MLNQSSLGVFVSAIVLSQAPPVNRKGIGKNGKAYDFWSRATQLFAGPVAGTVVIDEMGNDAQDFATIPPVGSIFSFSPKKADMNNGLLTFSLK